jgi:hypothetical protein
MYVAMSIFYAVAHLVSISSAHYVVDSRAAFQHLGKSSDVGVVEAASPAKSLLRHESQLGHASFIAKREIRTNTIDNLSADDWKAAAEGRFLEIQSTKEGVHHTIFAARSSDDSHKCGEPCVAHCVAGQPRDMIHEKGLWKSIKHRLFEQMSESPQIFATLALGAVEASHGSEGTEGYVRTPQAEVQNEDVLPSFDYLGVTRALLIRETCTTGSCLQKDLRLKCKAADMNITEMYDKSTGMYKNLCEVQMSRFADCMHLVRGYEKETKTKFDWVTRPRPDVYWTRPAPLITSLDRDKAYFTPWAACGYGGMDWFFALPRRHADSVAQFSSGIQCSHFRHKSIQSVCLTCPGCECWMAAWMFASNVSFTRLPWGWFTPAKFCPGDACPSDWEVTQQNILGLDPRSIHEPCTRNANGAVWCPGL